MITGGAAEPGNRIIETGEEQRGRAPAAFLHEEKPDGMPGLDGLLRIILIRGGTGIVRVSGKRLSIVAPAVLCLNEKDTARLEEGVGWKAKAFCFHPWYINANFTYDSIRGKKEDFTVAEKQDAYLFDPFFERNESYQGQMNLDASSMRHLSGLLDSAQKEVEERAHDFWSCRARSYFLEFLFSLVRAYRSPERTAGDTISASTSLADRTMLYINSHYSRKMTISDLCGMFNTNKTTLQEQFRKATGQSVMGYLIALRVKLAALMLKDTAMTVAEIIETLGFNDYSHFNKTFKKLTGQSPTQYRKNFTWMK